MTLMIVMIIQVVVDDSARSKAKKRPAKRKAGRSDYESKWRKIEVDQGVLSKFDGFVGLEELTDYDPNTYASTNVYEVSFSQLAMILISRVIQPRRIVKKRRKRARPAMWKVDESNPVNQNQRLHLPTLLNLPQAKKRRK